MARIAKRTAIAVLVVTVFLYNNINSGKSVEKVKKGSHTDTAARTSSPWNQLNNRTKFELALGQKPHPQYSVVAAIMSS